MQREGEIGDELGARDEEEEEGWTVFFLDLLINKYTHVFSTIERNVKRKKQPKNKQHVPEPRSPNDPTPPHRPPDRRVPPHAPPAQDQVRGEGRLVPARQRGEEEEGGHAEVVQQLEGEDLGEDLPGG